MQGTHQQKASVGLVAAHPLLSLIQRSLHGLDDIGRANARARCLSEPARFFQRGIAAHRRGHALRAQVVGTQNTQHIAAQPLAALIRQQRSVGIPVG